jgi:phosphoglycolate phosphatase
MFTALSGSTVVFDLDGTLVDTAPDLLRALQCVLAEAQLPPVSEADVRHLVGHGARAMLEAVGRLNGVLLEEAALAGLTERFIALYRVDIARESRPFPHAVEAMAALAAAGARLAVCTNKRTDLAQALLKALNLADRFAAILGADAVTARKPDPRHLLETIAAAGGSPDLAVMVGDTAADVTAAQAAGVPAIAVAFGYGQAQTLSAERVIDSFAELPAAAHALLLARRDAAATAPRESSRGA